VENRAVGSSQLFLKRLGQNSAHQSGSDDGRLAIVGVVGLTCSMDALGSIPLNAPLDEPSIVGHVSRLLFSPFPYRSGQ